MEPYYQAYHRFASLIETSSTRVGIGQGGPTHPHMRVRTHGYMGVKSNFNKFKSK